MKQLLFLLLFPCLALAQYQGNSNQKITLGEQTTADGLVWRGRLADTANLLTNKLDTSVYIVLDTGTRAMWYYRASTTPKWTRLVDSLNNLQGQLSLTSKVTGTLPVANGGTNNTSYISGAIPFSNGTTLTSDTSKIFFDNSNNRIGFGTSVPLESFHLRRNFNGASLMRFDNISTQTAASARVQVLNNNESVTQMASFGSGFAFSIFGINVANYGVLTTLGDNSNGLMIGAITNDPVIFGTNETERMRITSAGEVWIGYTADNGAYPLQVNGQIFATNATIATSDEKFKENITPLNKGLEIVNKLKPVTFNFISDTENNFSEYEEVGFIAQDVDRALSTETFAKSIVKSADDSEPTSTMGLATQNLIPILTKAIQEQQALIKALEQRILTLENK